MQLQRSCRSALRWLILFSLDLVRALVLSVVSVALARCVVAGACVSAPVSAKDARQIRQLVRAQTDAPIRCIVPVSNETPVPHSITGIEYALAANGTRKDLYTRTDSASVMTGPSSQNYGDMYKVQKVHGIWRIISKSQWVM